MTGTGRFRTIPLGGATGYVFEDLEDGLVAVGFWYRDAIGVSVAAPDLATARDAAEQMVHAGEFGEPIPL